MKRIVIINCPVHSVYGLAIDDTRITNLKCCGSWEELDSFVLTSDLKLALTHALDDRFADAGKVIQTYAHNIAHADMIFDNEYEQKEQLNEQATVHKMAASTVPV